jgi:hypothetical protein
MESERKTKKMAERQWPDGPRIAEVDTRIEIQ